MSNDTITSIVSNVPTLMSIAAFFISLATFSVAYSQVKIASAKTKLDLYNKRFAVYISALDYYHTTFESHDKIKERGNHLTKAYRESLFLFEPSSGIYETLGKIRQNGSRIHAYKEHKYKIENNSTNDRCDLHEMHEKSMNASFDLEKNLLKLEEQIKKYIQFKTITGWSFFR